MWGRRFRLPILKARRFHTFFYPDSVIDWEIVQLLDQAAGPADGRLHYSRCTEAEEYFLAVLGKESGAGLEPTRLASGFGLNGDRRADCVRIAFDAAEVEGDGGREIGNNVLQQSQLRAVAVFQEHFLAAIVIEVG